MSRSNNVTCMLQKIFLNFMLLLCFFLCAPYFGKYVLMCILCFLYLLTYFLHRQHLYELSTCFSQHNMTNVENLTPMWIQEQFVNSISFHALAIATLTTHGPPQHRITSTILPIIKYHFGCIYSQTYKDCPTFVKSRVMAYVLPICPWNVNTMIYDALHYLYWFSTTT